jgi:hypothetical protein
MRGHSQSSGKPSAMAMQRLPKAEESRAENAAYDSQSDDDRIGAAMTTGGAYWDRQPAGAGQGIMALRRTIGGE